MQLALNLTVKGEKTRVIPEACELDTAAQPQAILHVSMDLVYFTSSKFESYGSLCNSRWPRIVCDAERAGGFPHRLVEIECCSSTACPILVLGMDYAREAAAVVCRPAFWEIIH